MKITENWLRKKAACDEGIEWFSHSSQNDPIVVLKLLISENRLNWANWLIVRVMKRKHYLAYAIFAAEQVLEIYEKKYPNNKCPSHAIKAAKTVLKKDTKETRIAAAYAADAAAYASDAAAYAAAYASDAAKNKLQLKILEYGISLFEKET